MRVGHGGFFLVALLRLFASGFLRSDGYGDGVEASSLGQAADDVRALHGLSGRAFSQVIDGAHGDEHARRRVHGRPIWALFVPATEDVFGREPASSTCTKGLSR